MIFKQSKAQCRITSCDILNEFIVFGTDRTNKFYIRNLKNCNNPLKGQYQYDEGIGNIAVIIDNIKKDNIEIISNSCKLF